MSIGSLLSMRPTWLLGNQYTLTGNNAFEGRLVGAGLPSTEQISWANAQCKVDLQAGGKGVIQAAPQAMKAYGFLPWRAGGATFLELDPGAQLVLTGPLTACTVWAFRAAGTTVLVHANANGPVEWTNMTAGQRTQNMDDKTALVTAIKARYAGAAADLGRLTYIAAGGAAAGAQTYSGYMGFVIGCKARLGFSLNKVSWTASKAADDWTFYFYGYNGTAATDRVLRVLT
jgi:hypothetical protein